MTPETNETSREQRVNEVIAEYLRAADAGRAPDRAELLARHADVADDLRAFFADHDDAARLAPPAVPAANMATLAPNEPIVPPTGTHLHYFGDYELVEEIARGGMGVVYKARQVSLNRVVALKMILARELATEEDVRRFQVEARLAASLQHPAIVAIHEVGEHQGQHYFSMDYVEGRSLADLVRDSPLSAAETVRVVKPVVEAIHYAHTQGVLHRDLKPSNILLDREGRPRVTDFGLARKIDGGQGLTATGAVLGTPSYMPPEQAAGHHDQLGPASDVYSLGAVLYECLTGRPPYKAATALDTLLQVLSTDAAAPSVLNPGVDRDLETIALKCLAREPERRYASAQELADDLQAYLDGRPIRARRPDLRERAARWLWRQRRSVIPAAISAAVAALLIVGALVGHDRYDRWQRGDVFLTTNGPTLVAEVHDDQGTLAVPRFSVPTEEPFSLRPGEHHLHLAGRGLLSEELRLVVERGRERQLDVGLGERQPWKRPLVVPRTFALAELDGRHDVLLLGTAGVQRIHGATGKMVWQADLDAKAHPALADFPWNWKEHSSPSGKGPFDRRPQLVRPAPDLDGDGTGDLVFASRERGNLLALSGKSGRVLWCYPEKKQGPQVHEATAAGAPVLLDVDGDGVPDLVCAFATTGAPRDRQGGPKPAARRWIEAISGRTGKSLWQYTLEPEWFNPPAEMVVPEAVQWFVGTGFGVTGGVNWRVGQIFPGRVSSRTGDWLAIPYPVQMVQSGGRPVAVTVAGSRLVVLDPHSGKPDGPARELGFWPAKAPLITSLDGDGRLDAVLLQPGPVEKMSVIAVALADGARRWQADVRAVWRPRWEVQPPDWPIAADLDGDGKPEIIVPTAGTGPNGNWVGVTVLDGKSGERRWERPLVRSGWEELEQVDRFVVGPDLDGDGLREVFAVALEGENTPRVYRQALLSCYALAGQDGHSLWCARHRPRDGALSTYPGPYLGPLRWWQTGPDGLPELVVPFTSNTDGGWPTTFVLELRTGRLLHLGMDFPEPVLADCDGDGLADLVAFRPDKPNAPDHGGTLAIARGLAPQLWKLGGWWRPVADLDGDGVTDLVTGLIHRNTSLSGGERRGPVLSGSQMIAVSGRDGHTLWTSDSLDDTKRKPLAVSDLDGDGTPDLLLLYDTHSLSEQPFAPLEAFSGRTGGRLWTAGVRVETYTGTACLESRDLDGDGKPEVIWMASVVWPSVPARTTRNSNEGQLWLMVLSGRDGSLLWRQPASDPSLSGTNLGTQTRFEPAVADLDGDGTLDIVVPVVVGEHGCALQAFSGRDGRMLWRQELATRESRYTVFHNLPTPVVADLDGDGKPVVLVLDNTDPERNDGKGFSEVVALEGATGAVRWRHRGRYDHQSAHLDDDERRNQQRPRPLFVRLGEGRVGVCVWRFGGGPVTLLDAAGHVLGERTVEYSNGNYGIFRVWNQDLDGDGTDDLLLIDGGKVRAMRGGLEKVLWEWPLPEGTGDVIEIRPGSPPTVVVRSKQALYGLDGRTGQPRWRCDGPGLLLGSLGGRDLAAPPFAAYLLYDSESAYDSDRTYRATVGRAGLPLGPDGSYVQPGEPFADPGAPEKDPRRLRPLPWDPMNLPLMWVTGMAWTVGVLVVPILLAFWAWRQRSWRLAILPLLWPGIVLSLTFLIAYVQDETALRYQHWTSFVIRLAQSLGWHALAGVPALVFTSLAVWWLVQGRWRRLALLLMASLALALVIALIWLRIDAARAGADEERTWGGWPSAWFLGAYAAGVAAVLVIVTRAGVGRMRRLLARRLGAGITGRR